MAYAFMTHNTAYEVRDGRITRYGSGDITDRCTGAKVHSIMDHVMVRIEDMPKVGERCLFHITDESHPLFGLPIQTSPVNLVAPIVEVEIEEL